MGGSLVIMLTFLFDLWLCFGKKGFREGFMWCICHTILAFLDLVERIVIVEVDVL
jgi:hypothetical protein